MPSNLNFPTNPTAGQIHSVNGRTWYWTGNSWAFQRIAVPGKSAYQVALDNGFVGSESDWLASLRATIAQSTIDNILDLARQAASAASASDVNAIAIAKAAVLAARDHTDLVFSQAQDLINSARYSGEAALEANANEQLQKIQVARAAAESALDSIFNARATIIAQAGTDAQNAATASVTASQLASAKADEASQSATAATGAATQAATSYTGAQQSASSAQSYAGQASSSASDAQGSAAIALAKQGLAAQSATDAAYSAQAAQASEQSAAASSTASGSYAESASQSSNTASTRAQDSSNSADSSASYSQVAQSNSTMAAQQASAAEQHKLAAAISAVQLFPSTFERSDYWTNVRDGQYPADTTMGLFANDSQSGFVYQTSSPSSTILASKGFQAAQSNRRYRITAKVRQSVPSPNHLANHVSIDLYGLNTLFNGVTKNSVGVAAVGSVGVSYDLTTTDWIIIGVEFTIADPEVARYLRPFITIGGNTGSTVQVSYLKIEDTTESSRAGDSAAAAVATLATVQARATETAQYAQSALTSSTNAATNAGNAQTAAGQASQAASNAATSASQSSESATTAQGSAAIAGAASQVAVASKNAAGLSANAAALSATGAASSATDAGISAAAAQSYLVQAQLGSDLAYPSNFNNNDADYAIGGTATYDFVSVDDQNLLEFTGGVGTVYHKLARPLIIGRRYQLIVEARATMDTTMASSIVVSRLSTQGQMGQGDYTTGEATGRSLDYQTHTLLVSEGWTTFAREYTGVAGDKPYIRSYFEAHVESGSIQIRTMAIRDITDVYFSGRSANAAATSEANAAVSQNAASQSATSAQQSATQAQVSADAANQSAAGASTSQSQASLAAQNAQGSASSASQSASNAANSATISGNKAQASTDSASFAATKANEASNSSSSAAGFANQAQTQASNALGSATSAATSASTSSSKATDAGNSATAAASSALTASNKAADAQTSATAASGSAVAADASNTSARNFSNLASQFSGGSINSNPVFTRYTSGAAGAVADDWTTANQTSGGALRVSGETQGYAMRLVSLANQDSYTAQTLPKIQPNTWWVLEADVSLNSGTFSGSGVLFRSLTNGTGDLSIVFSTDKDTTDAVVGNGIAGNVYRFRKLVKVNNSTTDSYGVLFLMSHFSTLGSTASANSITWYRCSVRPATNSEIAAQRADGNSSLALAQISDEATTRATQTSALATRASNLESTVNSPTNGNAALTSRIATEETTRSNAVNTLATRTTSLESRAVGGGNLLTNTDFLTTDGWSLNIATTGVAVNSGINLAGGNPPGENTISMYQGARSTPASAYLEWQSPLVSVTPGSYIQAYAFVAAYRSDNATMLVYWRDASGNVVGFQDPNVNPGPGTYNAAIPGGYNQIGITSVVVPANAVQATLNLRKYNTAAGQVDSYAWYWRPYLGIAAANQSAFSSYNPGSARANLAANTARIATEETTRANADSSLATRASNLESKFNLDQDSNLFSRIRSEETTRANADNALSTRATTLESQAAGTASSGLKTLINNNRKNLAQVDWWKAGATIPWSFNGGRQNVIYSLPDGSNGNIMGPDGSSADVWLAQADSSGQAGGGWTNGTMAPLDPDKTYRFVLPIAQLGADTTRSSYWGTDSVCAINSTTGYSNPYFANCGSLPVHNRWYLFVGFIFPRNSTGKTADGAGIFDTVTGGQISGGVNYCFYPDGRQPIHRAYQYYATDTDLQVFGRPIIECVDGSETNIQAALNAARLSTTNTARIATEETTRANADSSLATRATTLESMFAGTTGSALQSRIATEETTRSNADSTLASRSSTLESKAGSGNSFNYNPTFALYTNATGPADGWANYDNNNGGQHYRVAGENGAGNGYAMRASAAANQHCYIAQSIPSLIAGNWYVIEADILLNSGTLHSTGIYLPGILGYGFYGNADVSGNVVGAGTPGRTYRFRFLFQASANCAGFYPMTHWSGLGYDFTQAVDVTWFRCAIRVASGPEIAANKATTDIQTTIARIATEETTRANAVSAVASRTSTLESSVVNDPNSITKNAIFNAAGFNYDGSGYQIPPYFSAWAREASEYIGPYTGTTTSRHYTNAPLQIDRNSNNIGIQQVYFGLGTGYYVIDVDVSIESGVWQSIGTHINFGNGYAYNFHFGEQADNNGTVYSGGGNGNRQFSFLAYNGAPSSQTNHYIMAGWSGFGGNPGFTRTIWHKWRLRPASQAEIAAKKANDLITPLTSRVSTSESAISNLNGKTQASWTVQADAGNSRAQLSVRADAYGSAGVDIVGDVAIKGSSGNGRTVITGQGVQVYDPNNVLRVRLGIF